MSRHGASCHVLAGIQRWRIFRARARWGVRSDGTERLLAVSQSVILRSRSFVLRPSGISSGHSAFIACVAARLLASLLGPRSSGPPAGLASTWLSEVENIR